MATDEWAAALSHRNALPRAQTIELPPPALFEKAGLTPALVSAAIADHGLGIRAAIVEGDLDRWGGLQALPLLLMEISAAGSAESAAVSAATTWAWRQLSRDHSIVSLSRSYGISRQTLHRRIKREAPLSLIVPDREALTAEPDVRDRQEQKLLKEGLSVVDVAGIPLGVYSIEELSSQLASPLPRWETEAAFLQERPERTYSVDYLPFSDSPTDPASWSVKYLPGTREVYAYRTTAGLGIHAARDTDGPFETSPRRGEPGWPGDAMGPCYVIGIAETEAVYRSALEKFSLRYRPGGVAWAYEQLQFATAVLHAARNSEEWD